MMRAQESDSDSDSAQLVSTLLLVSEAPTPSTTPTAALPVTPRFRRGVGPGALTERDGGAFVISTPATVYQRITRGVHAGRVGVLQPRHPSSRDSFALYVVELSAGPVLIPREDLELSTRADYERDREANP